MKSLRLAALACLAFAISACGITSLATTAVDVLGTPSPVVSTAGDKVVLEGTRGLVLANNAYQGAAAAAIPLIRAKALPPATVDRIEALSNRAVYLLEKGDQGMTLATRAAGVLAIADDINRLIGR